MVSFGHRDLALNTHLREFRAKYNFPPLVPGFRHRGSVRSLPIYVDGISLYLNFYTLHSLCLLFVVHHIQVRFTRAYSSRIRFLYHFGLNFFINRKRSPVGFRFLLCLGCIDYANEGLLRLLCVLHFNERLLLARDPFRAVTFTPVLADRSTQ